MMKKTLIYRKFSSSVSHLLLSSSVLCYRDFFCFLLVLRLESSLLKLQTIPLNVTTFIILWNGNSINWSTPFERINFLNINQTRLNCTMCKQMSIDASKSQPSLWWIHAFLKMKLFSFFCVVCETKGNVLFDEMNVCEKYFTFMCNYVLKTFDISKMVNYKIKRMTF